MPAFLTSKRALPRLLMMIWCHFTFHMRWAPMAAVICAFTLWYTAGTIHTYDDSDDLLRPRRWYTHIWWDSMRLRHKLLSMPPPYEYCRRHYFRCRADDIACHEHAMPVCDIRRFSPLYICWGAPPRACAPYAASAAFIAAVTRRHIYFRHATPFSHAARIFATIFSLIFSRRYAWRALRYEHVERDATPFWGWYCRRYIWYMPAFRHAAAARRAIFAIRYEQPSFSLYIFSMI